MNPCVKRCNSILNYAEAHFVLGTALRKSGHAAEGTREQKVSLTLQEKKRQAAIGKTESQ